MVVPKNIKKGTLVRFMDGRAPGVRNSMPISEIYHDGTIIHIVVPVDRPYSYSLPQERKRVEKAMALAEKTGYVVSV